MLKKIALALAVALVGFGAVVASRPSTYHVERSITVAAPVDLPFGLVNDFHRWRFWSPWEALDPKMKKTFDGPYAGPGAIYEWAGNKDAGKGRMTILESKPYESISILLEFTEPWASTNHTAFTFQPVPEGIRVTWAMEGKNDFLGKAFSLFMDMDGMIGKDFEKGLASMKTLAETEAKKRAEEAARLAAEKAAAEKAAAEAAAAAADAAAAVEGSTAAAPAP